MASSSAHGRSQSPHSVLIYWNAFKFVDKVGARTPQKVVLQTPDIKTIML